MLSLRRFLLPLVTLTGLSIATGAFAAEPTRLGDLRGVDQASFNHDSSRVIVRGREGEIGIWDISTGNMIAGDLSPEARANGYILSADANRVLVGLTDGHARVFDATTAKALSPVLDIKLQSQLQMPALFSPDGATIIIFMENEAAVFNVSDGKRIATIPLPVGPDEETPGSAAFTADGAQCFVMDGLGAVTRYNTKDWKPAGKPMAHPAAESAYGFEFSISDDGKWLATCDGSGENGPKGNLQVWDVATARPLGKPLVAVNGFSARFVGPSRVVVTPGRGEATVRELPSMKVVFPVRKHDDVDGPKVDVSPNNKWIFAWGYDRNFELYDAAAATGKLAGNGHAAATISKVMLAPDSSGCYVVFDNSAFLVQGHYDYYIVRYDFPALNLTETVRIVDSVQNASLSRDGKRLLAIQGTSEKDRVLLFDAATLKPLD
jgi:WD40 repeat protein